ncbi:MAG: hypothetical protein ACRYFW_03785 [Janthinobacterium lividum]
MSPNDPRTSPAVIPDVAEHQPLVDAFTDVPQADGQRPAEHEIDGDDMFVQSGE